VEPVELDEESFQEAMGEHVALAARVHELLNEAGLLGRLRPFTPG
jgi:hypothetical protein